MSTTPIDLSAGMEPAPQAPAPQSVGTPIDLSAGMEAPASATPAKPQGTLDYLLHGNPAVHDIGGATLGSAARGIGDTVMDTAASLSQFTHGLGERIHHGLGEAIAPQSMIDAEHAKAVPGDGAEGASKVLAEVGEFFMGDSALAGLSLSEKLARIAPAIKALERSPSMLNIAKGAMARAAITGARQGAVGAAQSAAQGNTAGDALKQGGEAGALGGAAELAGGVFRGARAVYEAVKPTEKVVAGVRVPLLRTQVKTPLGDPVPISQADATPGDTPKYAQAQQLAMRQVEQNLAQRSLRQSIDQLNKTRMAIDPGKLLSAPDGPQRAFFDVPTGNAPVDEGYGDQAAFDPRKKQIGTRLVSKPEGSYDPEAPGQAVRKEPAFQYMTGVKPGEEPVQVPVEGAGVHQTNDPHEAQRALSDLDRQADDGSLPDHMRDAHKTLRDQVDMFHAQQAGESHFHLIDPDGAVEGVRDYGDAADRLSNLSRPVWDAIDQSSRGEFAKLQRAQKEALRVIREGTNLNSIDAAHARLHDIEKSTNDVFDHAAGTVSRREIGAIKNSYAHEMVMRKIDATMEGATNGVTLTDEAAEPGSLQKQYTGLSARVVQRLVKSEPRVTTMMGEDGVRNLKTMGTLLHEPKLSNDASSLSSLLSGHIAGHMLRGGIGGVVGGAASESSGHGFAPGFLGGITVGVGHRALMRRLMTNPKAGALFDFAVRHRVAAKTAVPILSGLLSNQSSQPAQEPAQ